MDNTEASAQDAFSAYFASPTRYGERWHQTLYPALTQQPTNPILFYNRYTPLEDFYRITGSPETTERVRFPSAADDIQADNLSCFSWIKPPASLHQRPEPASNGLKTYCYINTAAALAVHLLRVLPGDRVLEHSNGNASTSLAMAQSIWPHLQPSSPTPPLAGAKKGALHANWVDSGSKDSIEASFAGYVPASLAATGEAKVLGDDVAEDADEAIEKPPLGAGGYDKVSVKAACLSDYYLLESRRSPEGAAVMFPTWPPEDSAVITEAQIRLLLAALQAVRVGGRVMYVTPAIAREENDGVVEAAMLWARNEMEKGSLSWTVGVEGFGAEVEKQLEDGWAERTEKGWIVLPDHASGRKLGPLYFCMLTKRRDQG